jgi:hypothetical protein
VKYLLCLLLAGCYTAQTVPPARLVPAPSVVEPTPLRVGPWARSRELDHGVAAGSMELQVVGEAPCGQWVQATLYGGGEGRVWMLCVRDNGELAAALFNGVEVVDPARPGAHEADLVGLRTRIVPRTLDGARRETVRVDAGTFEDAIVEPSAASTLWSHPDVPFAGVVKIVDPSGRADSLVAYGDEPPPPPAARDRLREFVEVGAGVGWLSGVPMQFPDRTLVTDFALGFHATNDKDLLMALSGGKTSSNGYGVDTSSATLLITIGGRWRPLAVPLYLQLTGGFARLWQYESIDINGFGVSAGVGYPVLHAHDWTFDVRVADELAFFGTNVDVRTQLQLGGRFVLTLP